MMHLGRSQLLAVVAALLAVVVSLSVVHAENTVLQRTEVETDTAKGPTAEDSIAPAETGKAVGGAGDEGTDAGQPEGDKDAATRDLLHGFQCEMCRQLVSSVVNKLGYGPDSTKRDSFAPGSDIGIAGNTPREELGKTSEAGNNNALEEMAMLLLQEDGDGNPQAGPAAAGDVAGALCSGLKHTATMAASSWSAQNMRDGCLEFINSKGSELRNFLSPFTVCRRMGHCGTFAERSEVRASGYEQNVQITRYLKAKKKKTDENHEWFPLISKIDPVEGPSSGGQKVTITGKGFTEDAICLFDKVSSPTMEFHSDTEIVCVSPYHATPGPVRLQVFGKNQNGDPSLSQPGAPYRYTIKFEDIPDKLVWLDANDLKKKNNERVGSWGSTWAAVVPMGAPPQNSEFTVSQDGDDLKPAFQIADPVLINSNPFVHFARGERMRGPGNSINQFQLPDVNGGITFVAVLRPTARRRAPSIPFVFDFGRLGIRKGFGFAVATNFLYMYSAAEVTVKVLETEDQYLKNFMIVTAQFVFDQVQRLRINSREWVLNQEIQKGSLPDFAKNHRTIATAESGVPTIAGEAQVPGDQNSGFDGDIAEFTAYGKALNPEEMRTVEEYLSEKYKIEIGPYTNA